MKLGLPCLLVMPVLLGSLAHLTGAENPAKEATYYPLTVGTKWVYKTSTAGNTNRVVIRVVKEEKVGDVLCFRLEAASGDGEKPVTEHVAKRADPPLRVLKLPPRVGDCWEIDSKIAGVQVKGTFTIGEAEVSVPRGKYKAITAQTKDMTLAGEKMEQTLWFARDVGMVKQVIKKVVKAEEQETVLELEEFESPK